MPPTHALLVHWLLVMHACPGFSLHCAAPSQLIVPVHALAGKVSSLSIGSATQLPAEPGTLQARHVVVQALAQQTPSTQLPLKHSAAPTHAAPVTFLQTPLPSHWLLPMQRFVGELSVLPTGRLPHVPTLPATLHDLHTVSHALLQQIPSAQKLLRHALFVAQG